MKKLLILFIYFSFVSSLLAQFKQNTKADYAWMMGYGFMVDSTNSWKFDFNNNQMQYSLKYKLLNSFYSTANICDKNGKIAFQTNACKIADIQNQVIVGGDTINNSPAYVSICNSNNGGLPIQGQVILPSMTDDTSYFMFHSRMNYYFDARVGSYGVDRLLLSKIVKDSERYKVVFKDSIILDYKRDSILIDGNLTACRHGNGRDWWVVVPKLFEKDYYTILFTPNGFEKQLNKNIGINRTLSESGSGMSVFSPDGRKYIEYNADSDVQIFDFDRCTGQLSNFRHIEIHDYADIYKFTGCAISSNSRFLYLTSIGHIYQYDLESNSLLNSKYTFELDTTFVDYYQGVGLRSSFLSCQLGYDGKIYISNLGSRKYMHVIEHPDLKGTACELRQNAITLPVYISWAIPFFPNYRLGALTSSPCDTLGSTATHDISPQGRLKIYPNPAHDFLKVDMTLDDYEELETCQLRIRDIIGRVHQTYPLSNYASVKEVSVANLVNGLYFVELVDKQGLVLAKNKIIVSR